MDRNRMYITLKGRIGQEESNQAATRVLEKLKALKPGFDVIADISEFEPATWRETELLIQVNQIFIGMGVGRITRVDGRCREADTSTMRYQGICQSATLVPEQFDTVKNAERFLDRQD